MIFTDEALAQHLNGKIISLRSHHGKYVAAEASGHANANRARVGPWEKFRVELVSGNRIALKSVAHNRYLVAESNGQANANRVHRGPWEIFRLMKVSDRRFALRSHHGKYLVAESNGHLNANRVHRGPWELFDFDFPQGKKDFPRSYWTKIVLVKILSSEGFPKGNFFIILALVLPFIYQNELDLEVKEAFSRA